MELNYFFFFLNGFLFIWQMQYIMNRQKAICFNDV